MNESMLRSFLQMIAGFSLYSNAQPIKLTRKYIGGYIERNFGKKLVDTKLNDFDQFIQTAKDAPNVEKLLQLICYNITKDFSQQQRFLLLIYFFNFFTFNQTLAFSGKTQSNPHVDILDQIAQWLKLNNNDFQNCKHFALGQLHSIPQKQNLLIAASHNPKISDINFLESKGIKGYITFLHLVSAKLLIFTYNGTSRLEMYGKPIFSNTTYIFSTGHILSVLGADPLYYGEVYRSLLNTGDKEVFALGAENISYNYQQSDQGIKDLTFWAKSGEIHGILGGSGVGKSTLIKLLCGNLKPLKGRVLVNGHNLYEQPNRYKGIIGVLHQEECLIEELTVFENLYFSAKASLAEMSHVDLVTLCEEKLFELELNDCQNNRVGPPDNRQLSGGQRKRLAIAMEIIREPKVLFVDEPTSGLSSADSEMVMNILKSIALEGKLVIVNIHQPSSEVFKLFDSVLLIDKGGVPIYSGHPIEAILYFKGETDKVDRHQSGCEHCGTIKPESIFEMVEERNIDELGQRIAHRKLSPSDWHHKFSNKFPNSSPSLLKSEIPKAVFLLPKPVSQFKTFFVRNMLTKARNSEFLFFALVLPPVLSVLISIFLRYSIPSGLDDQEYSLFSNPNIPSFFLMCILSSLFFGLIISCEDIIRDKRLIFREFNIGLNIRCLYNAKLLFLLLISVMQTLLLTLPGILILEIKGTLLPLWLILFLLSFIGNLFGLILSATLKSVVAIYILVPFLLIPQILFSGLVVRFDNLNPRFTSQQHVPVIGEIMPSRWAVEAVIVNFFMANRYNKTMYTHNFRESELRFRLLHLIPELNELAYNLVENPQEISINDIKLLRSGFDILQQENTQKEYSKIFETWTQNSIHEIVDLLEVYKNSTANDYSSVKYDRDRLIESIYPNTNEGRRKMLETKMKYHNLAIEDLVRNRHYPLPLVQSDNIYIQKSDPIYQIPISPYGRSHLFAPYKSVGPLLLETYWYNTIVLVLIIAACYVVFILNLVPKIFKRLSR